MSYPYILSSKITSEIFLNNIIENRVIFLKKNFKHFFPKSLVCGCMDEGELQAYEEGSFGSMSDDLEDDSAAEDELDYYESGDRESSYDDEDTPVPTTEPVEICLLYSDSE
ncbi:uncharacterized protein EV154DRAFT_480130 [Mucor mucedo]|uniref:uncharacterized protein n=1 Tax=Mucor mucedo TaxID=29922 RepID=UPI00221F2553|nr:uncharacterized protein EV154DRAFT_480130 [Mucor mucedo]KAI7892630.1 hypothetical protein EV154DRAFT_480130 [Mucor mucedo]